jgi:F0F1-type ATP synthase assembly protein I
MKKESPTKDRHDLEMFGGVMLGVTVIWGIIFLLDYGFRKSPGVTWLAILLVLGIIASVISIATDEEIQKKRKQNRSAGP